MGWVMRPPTTHGLRMIVKIDIQFRICSFLERFFFFFPLPDIALQRGRKLLAVYECHRYDNFPEYCLSCLNSSARYLPAPFTIYDLGRRDEWPCCKKNHSKTKNQDITSLCLVIY